MLVINDDHNGFHDHIRQHLFVTMRESYTRINELKSGWLIGKLPIESGNDDRKKEDEVITIQVGDFQTARNKINRPNSTPKPPSKEIEIGTKLKMLCFGYIVYNLLFEIHIEIEFGIEQIQVEGYCRKPLSGGVTEANH